MGKIILKFPGSSRRKFEKGKEDVYKNGRLIKNFLYFTLHPFTINNAIVLFAWPPLDEYPVRILPFL